MSFTASGDDGSARKGKQGLCHNVADDANHLKLKSFSPADDV